MKLAQAENRFHRTPFAQVLGASIEELELERALLRLPHDPMHDNINGSLNGGATASMINMAGALAAWTGIDLDSADRLACVDMSVQYLSGAFGEDVLAEARVLRRGRDLFFLDVSVHTPEDKPICRGLMIYRSPDYAQHKPRYFDGYAARAAPATSQAWGERGFFKGFGEKLHMTAGEVAPGYCELNLGFPDSNSDGHGHVHEGAVASLVDFAGTVTAWSLIEDWNTARGATIGMQVAFAQPAREAVVARAFLEHRSEEAFISTVAVTGRNSGALICTGQVSYRLLETRE